MLDPKRTDEGSLVSAWQEQLAHASKNPFLLNLLLEQWQRVLKRLVYFYAQLASLPRRKRRALQRALATSLIGAAMLLALSSAPVAQAANIIVSGGCTLADAITAANTDTATGGCIAGDPGVDTITLTGNVLVAMGGLPAITSEITLEGGNFSVSGGTFYQVFSVSSTGDFTINETTIENGYANHGGGIFNDGTVEVNNSTFSGNHANGDGGAIVNNGVLTIANSTFSGNSANDDGGAIDNDYYGSLTIINSTFSGNRANTDAGAIYNDEEADLHITNSTLSGNTAGDDGGAIYNNEFGTLVLTNSTLSGNTAGDNGGAIYNFEFGTTGLNRTLISGNTATGDGDEIYNRDGGTINANNFNLFGNNDAGKNNAAAFSYFNPGLSDIVATSDGTVPTALANIVSTTLGNNGGPTQTLALVTNSPAIDGAPNAACTAAPINGVDQRGLPRNVNIFNGNPSFLCDIGAFELQATTAVNVTNLRGAARADKNVLRWKTATESQIAGFDVHRKTHKGEWKPVNANFMQAKNAGSVQGNKYRFADKQVKQGKTYRYKLQVKYLDGHTEWTDVIRVRVK